MPAENSTIASAGTPATFFCRLEFVEIQDALHPALEFADNFFLTNDQRTIDRLLEWRFVEMIGTLEFHHFKKAPVVAYRKFANVEADRAQKELFNSLVILDQFESMFWLHSDCCVGHEAAFLECGGNISSNFYGGIRCRANGTKTNLSLTAEQVSDLVELFKTKMARNIKDHVSIHTKVNSNRVSRALDYISRAQNSINPAEKIAFYCTALESLFSTSPSEIAHQIAERVAVVSTRNRDERNERYWFLKKCYDTRSKFLHGSALRDADALEVINRVTVLDDLVRKTFRSTLNDNALMAALNEDRSLDQFLMKRILGSE